MTWKKGTIAILLFIHAGTYAQVTDSLMAVLDTAKNERRVKTLNELFRAHIQSDPVKAIGFTREALNMATEIGDKKGMAASYNNLGVAYRNQGALDKSLEYYITSLRIYEELDNKEGIGTTKNNIANIYSMKKDYGQAMKFLEESHAMFVQLGDEFKVIGSMNNLGNLNSDLQLYEKAMKYFSESYQLSQKSGKPFADPVVNIGNLYFRQGNYQRAIEHYQQALEIEKKNNNRLGMLNTITNIGIAYTKAGQPTPARQYLTEAEKLANELQAYTSIPDILKNSSYNYYRQGNVKEAYEMFIRYDSAREKIYGEESSRRIAQMEIALDLSEKEKEFEIIRKEADIKTLQLRNSRLFIVLIVLGLFVFIGVINFYFLNKRRRLADSA